MGCKHLLGRAYSHLRGIEMDQRVYYYEDDKIKSETSTSRYKFVLKFVKNKQIIDIGCGARMGPYILSGVASRVFAIDVSKEAIRYCSIKWPSPNIFYLTADAINIPFGKNYFDVVLAFEVIEHIYDYEHYLEEIKRILKNEGLLILSTPNRPVASPRDKLSNPEHFREFDLEQLEKVLKRYFSKIIIYGQFPSKRILKIEEIRRNSYKATSKVPLFLKRMLPSWWKETLIKKYQYFNTRIIKNLDPKIISEEDFLFTTDNIEKARYLLAVCRR